MPRLPDRFDLWVRQARESNDPARRADYVLGALISLKAWHFLNVGTMDAPQPAVAEIEDGQYLLVFSDPGRIGEIFAERGEVLNPLPVITMPAVGALAWCLEQGGAGCSGVLVNPGEDAVLLPLAQMAVYHLEWLQRGGAQASGFWIPNLTSEEEDFWQEHGL